MKTLTQKGLDRYPENSERPQMPVQTTMPSKTFNTRDGEKKIFYNKVKFKQYLSIDPSL